MITVGVKGLENQLSRYLQYVKDGERIAVTEHNRIIAEIIVPEKKSVISSIEKKFERLKTEGKMILAKRQESLATKPKITDAEREIDWQAVYNEVKSDRF